MTGHPVKFDRSYALTFLGAITGSILLAVLAMVPVVLVYRQSFMASCDDVECEMGMLDFSWLVAAVFNVSFCAGGGAGSWLALRIGHATRPGLTAILVAAAYYASGYVLGFLTIVVVGIGVIAGIELVMLISMASVICIALASLVLCPFAARYLALH